MILRDAWVALTDLPWGPAGDTLVAWLLTYGVHSTVLLLLVGAILRLGRPRSVRLRERLLGLGLFGGLVTTSLQAALDVEPWLGRFRLPAAELASISTEPEPEITTVPASTSAKTSSSIVAVPPSPQDRPDRARERLSRRPTPPMNGATGAPAASGRRETSRPESPPRRNRAALPAPTRDELLALRAERDSQPSTSAGFLAPVADEGSAQRPLILLGWVWSLVALVALTGFILATARFAFHLRGRQRIGDGPARLMLDELQQQAARKRPVRLSHSPRISTPLCFGILSPEICLPSRALEELTGPQLRALLGHELAHTQRRDPLRFGALNLLAGLFFFQPLNRAARKRLLGAAEILCDDQAIRWTGDRVALASCLAQVAGWIVGPMPRPQLAAGMAATRSSLSDRIERLLDDRKSPTPEPRHRALTITLAATLLGSAWAVPGAAAGKSPDADRPEAVPAAIDTPAPRALPSATPLPPERPDALGAPRPAARPLLVSPAPALSGSQAGISAAVPSPKNRQADLERLLASSRDLAVDLGRFEQELLETTRLLQGSDLAPAIVERLADLEQRTTRFLEQRARFDALVNNLTDANLHP